MCLVRVKIRAWPIRLLRGQHQNCFAILITVACTLSMVFWDANVHQELLYGMSRLDCWWEKTNAGAGHSSLRAYLPELKRQMVFQGRPSGLAAIGTVRSR